MPMLTFTPAVAALSTSHEIGLALVAAAFIAFALVSSFVLPRRNPNFPGNHVGAFVGVAIVFFAGMVAAVLVLGKETPEASAKPATGAAPAATTTASGGGASAAPTAAQIAAGKTVFLTAGCKGCHTLKAAGATGNVGPNLDTLKPAEQIIVHQVEHGGKVMPPFQGTLSPTQIQDVAAFVYASTH